MKLSSPSLSIALVLASSMRSAVSFVQGQIGGRHSPGRLFLFDKLFSTAANKLPVMADESVMGKKAHGTSDKPVQKDLRWKCDFETADRICNFNSTSHIRLLLDHWL
jgi:hypothetical protein